MVFQWDILLVQDFYVGRNFYGPFRKNTDARIREITKPLKRYVDDTITYIKPDLVTNIIDILNRFHQKIKSAYEVEYIDKISFLDVFIIIYDYL